MSSSIHSHFLERVIARRREEECSLARLRHHPLEAIDLPRPTANAVSPSKLKAALKRLGLTQRDAAAILGVSRSVLLQRQTPAWRQTLEQELSLPDGALLPGSQLIESEEN